MVDGLGYTHQEYLDTLDRYAHPEFYIVAFEHQQNLIIPSRSASLEAPKADVPLVAARSCWCIGV